LSATDDKASQPVIINKPLDWAGTFALSQQAKSIRFVEDENGNLWGFPVVLIDPSSAAPIQARGSVTLKDFQSSTFASVEILYSGAVSTTGGNAGLHTFAHLMLDNTTAGSQKWESQRTPTFWKWALCTTVAATAVWTPTAGKKFRLMGLTICPDAGLAAAGIQKISLLDSATDIGINFQTYLPIAASIAHQVPIVVVFPGNGFLSAAANNVLNCTLTSACTAGGISISVFGTEE
jgi:hypothetical protein